MGHWRSKLLTVLLVGCVHSAHPVTGEEVVIEDRIGIPTSTNGRGSLVSVISGATYGATVGKHHVSETVRLTKIEAVGVPYDGRGPTPIGLYGWKIAIHSNATSAQNTSLLGDILPLTDLPVPTIEPVGSNFRGDPSYHVRFDFSSTSGLDNVVLNANTDYWVTVLGVSAGDWDWMETSFSAGEPDTWTVDDTFIWSWDSQFPIGRAALKFIGETLPLAGDYNRDGSVDAADYVVWRKTFGSALPHYDGADGNGDGTVDAADFTVWRDNFGSGGAASQATVPEPAGLAFVMCLFGPFARRTRCARRF